MATPPLSRSFPAILVVFVTAVVVVLAIAIGIAIQQRAGEKPSQGPVVEGRLFAPALTAVAAREVTNSTAVIRWTSDRPTDDQVEYGPTTTYDQATPVNPTLGTAHEVVLTNLDPGTTYHFRATGRTAFSGYGASADATFATLAAQRGHVTVCGWEGNFLVQNSSQCTTNDGWARGESWTTFCSTPWTLTSQHAVQDCVYQFTDVSAAATVSAGTPWQVTVGPDYTGWVDMLQVDVTPAGKDVFLPAVQQSENGRFTVDAPAKPGTYSYRFRPADDSASWSTIVTLIVQ